MVRRLDVRYVLRVWRHGSGRDAVRASLTELATGELHHFRDLAALSRHLEDVGEQSETTAFTRDLDAPPEEEP